MSTLTVWRICAPRYADTAYSGEGARLYGGRWNSKGRAVVYTSESLALAVLEQLVHTEDPTVLDTFVVASASFDGSLVEELPFSSLPSDWRAYPAPPSLKSIGDEWTDGVRSVVLRVPSVTVRGQYNYLVNPSHPDFGKVRVSEPEPLDLDPRLRGG